MLTLRELRQFAASENEKQAMVQFLELIADKIRESGLADLTKGSRPQGDRPSADESAGEERKAAPKFSLGRLAREPDHDYDPMQP